MSYIDSLWKFLNPDPNPELEKAADEWRQNLPTLWLLGKTGSGKSSFIQALTSYKKIEIGNGFRPCTQTSQEWDFPEDKPILRFIDTRGLGEADYDASEDINECRDRSHALIVVMRNDDPNQIDVLNAIKQIRKSDIFDRLMLIQNKWSHIDKDESDRLLVYQQQQVAEVWKKGIIEIEINLNPEDKHPEEFQQLIDRLSELLPIVKEVADKNQYKDEEEKIFRAVKKEVLWYSGAAGATDAVPALGLVTVPSIQAKMLHRLARQYEVEWSKRLLVEFVGALGTGFGVNYLSRLGVRQLMKFIPVYGQSIGAASATVLSFGSTYAIGRVACKYLYHKKKGENIPSSELQKLYKDAFIKSREVANSEKNN